MKTSSSSSTAVRMRIWIFGNCNFSRAVHSMPDMRGRKISISTTSGFSAGITRTASSPDAQACTQENPASESMSFTQLSRTPGLSSTRTTLTGGADAGLCGAQFTRQTPTAPRPPHPARRAVQRHGEHHQATAARLAGRLAGPADFAHPLRHVRQPVAFRAGLRGIKTLAVVLHRHDQLVILAVDPQEQFARLRILCRVVQRLFYSQK